MNDAPAFNPTTKHQLERFINQPSHALALIGPKGAGKTAVATWLIGQLANVNLAKHPYFRLISPDSQSISINEIRGLGQFLKLKTTGESNLRRFIVIEQAESLTLEAQNALLKLLEEPPADTLLVLTLNKREAVLPTISSRLQQILIRRPPKTELAALFKTNEFEQLYTLSGGRPGLLSAMIEQGNEHPLLQAVAVAKQLLQATTFERLVLINDLAKGDGSRSLLDALERIAETSLAQAARQHNEAALGRWQKVLSATHRASMTFGKGAQNKLALTELALNI
jgi:hypothetical protein